MSFVSVKWKFARIAKKLIYIGSFNIKLKLLAWIRFTFEQPLMKASEITTLFWPPMDFVKNLILSEAVIERCSTKWSFILKRAVKFTGFQRLVTAAMWTILDATRILDPPLELDIGKTMVTLISVLFLFTKFILIFQLKY